MSDATEGAEQKPPARTWPIKVELKHPIQFGKELIQSLEFQRGKLGHLKGLRTDRMPTIDELILIASRLCGKPIGVIELLDEEDSPEVLDIAGTFFGKCL